MSVMLRELIESVPKNLEQELEHLRRQERSRIVKALSTECRLTFNPRSDISDYIQKFQIPILLRPGCPDNLLSISFPANPEIFHKLIPYRGVLENSGVLTENLVKLLHDQYHTLTKIRTGNSKRGQLTGMGR